MKRRRYIPGQEPPPELSEHQKAADAWTREVGARCAKAIGAWLEANGHLSRQIHQLGMWELEGMAWDCIGAYNAAREEKRLELELPLGDEKAIDRTFGA